MLLADGTLYCYYADEREKNRNMLQVISVRSTTDLSTWSERTLVSGVPDTYRRPGMFVSTGKMPDGMYRAVIEVVGPHDVPIHLLESDSPAQWGDPQTSGAARVR
uniref:CAZy families GH93 protein n=1 Tax=uncultured Haloterrigena sp. TaxID=1432427 RepID=A0A060CCE3_9EURY|nr:CAZy families GH93 protein [uncultured Haloterrigena sp.]